jgi:probable HAF family extracellular repeat protein
MKLWQICVLLLTASTASATTYSVTEVTPGNPSSPSAIAASINGPGDVGGHDTAAFAILVRAGTTAETGLPVFLQNGDGGSVMALDDTLSHLVGWAWVHFADGFDRQRPVQWVPARCKHGDPTCKNGYQISDLGGFSACFDTEARGRNATGLIAGFATSHCTGTAWTMQNGVLTTLPPLPGGTQDAAYAVNDAGLVVGNSESGGTTTVHAASWQGGVARDLGALPGGLWAVADAVNSSGVAVGASTLNGGTFATGDRHAVVYQNGTVTDLTPSLPALEDAVALAINDTGAIVGAVNGSATIWVGGVATDLNTVITGAPGVRLGQAVAINASGVIAANGVIAGDGVNASRIFVLTPQ